jgi:hypothetical protein
MSCVFWLACAGWFQEVPAATITAIRRARKSKTYSFGRNGFIFSRPPTSSSSSLTGRRRKVMRVTGQP